MLGEAAGHKVCVAILYIDSLTVQLMILRGRGRVRVGLIGRSGGNRRERAQRRESRHIDLKLFTHLNSSIVCNLSIFISSIFISICMLVRLHIDVFFLGITIDKFLFCEHYHT